MVRLHIYLNWSNTFCEDSKESVLTRSSVHVGLLILLPKDTGFSDSLRFSILPLVGNVWGFLKPLQSYTCEALMCTQNDFTGDKANDREYSVVKQPALSIQQHQWREKKSWKETLWFNAIPMKTVFYMIYAYIYKNLVHKHETNLQLEVTEGRWVRWQQKTAYCKSTKQLATETRRNITV